MITHLHLKFGSRPGQPPLTFPTPSSVTIFVGPNNGGKSQALREIAEFAANGVSTANLILDRLDFASVDRATAEADIARMQVGPNRGETVGQGTVILKLPKSRIHVDRSQYIQARTQPQSRPNWAAVWHVGERTLQLDGSARIGLLNSQPRNNLLAPSNPFERIAIDDTNRAAFRKIVADALGLYFGIDAFSNNNLNAYFGSSSPPSDERSYSAAMLTWIDSARNISQVSDGVKAFAGIVLQLYAGDPSLIIVDEPEAFLHPSLAHRLGVELAKAAVDKQKHVFVATHSAHFLMGTIQSGATVNIVRLTYRDGIPTARLLDSASLVPLMNDPLLRSVGVLDGLFFEHVIVAEADADRALYGEINHRLLAANDGRGIPHALFLNAGGKSTVPKIVAPLRKLGIPTAAIVDVDIVKDDGAAFTKHLIAAGYPEPQHTSCHNHKQNVLRAFEAAAPADAKKREYFKAAGGIDLLKDAGKESAINFFDDLERYGYLIVRRGEIESWLPHLDVTRNKRNTGDESFRANIFAAMGNDPKAPSYQKPATGDVWDFIGQARKWLTNPDRRGIPN